MSLVYDPTSRDLNDCDCCAGLSAQTPVAVYNRPGLSAIAHRVGTHSRFKSSMLARLSAADLPALRDLQTRDDDDFAVALLDAWAMVADVLTFYQERIANESYLRTAIERRSLRHLAELIGYKLRPGVAASTYLAFTVEDAKGAPVQTRVEKGTRVQSIPGPGQVTQEQTPAMVLERQTVTVKGVATNLKPGDSLLVVTGPESDDREVMRVVKVVPDPEGQTTRIDLLYDPPDPPSFVMLPLTPGVFFTTATQLTDDVVATSLLNATWNQASMYALAMVQNWPITALMTNIQAQVAHREFPLETGVFAFRQRAALFGHNAPKWDSLPANQRYGEKVSDVNDVIVPVQPAYPEDEKWDDWTLAQEQDPADVHQIFLDNTYPGIIAESWLVLESPTQQKVYRVKDNAEISRSTFTLNAKVSRLRLDNDDGFTTFKLRETTVLAQSEQLELADLPIVDPVQDSSVVLDRVCLGLKVGQKVIVTGERTDLEGVIESEVMTLADVTFTGGFTVLTFQQGLANSYKRDTVTVNANVALATHGETQEEVLGHGDSLRPFQRFTLRQPPLTYVSAATPSGSESTLEVHVNDLLWREAPSLYGRGPDEHVYTSNTDDDGKTVVQFGDGRTGSRLPTGQENVRATYRKGMGEEGLVEAGQLSLLMTRPLGVRGVSNPVPASAAADGETPDEVRLNAPLTILTLDRIVSLQDYQDFARAFAGIAKALATWTWDGQYSGVFVTVAGPKGAAVAEGSPTYENLLAAMQKAGDPRVPLRVRSFRRAYFRLAGKIRLDPEHMPEKVITAITESLRATFSFEARAFGQPVTSSEVIAVIQKVPGVVAVDLDQLYRTDAAAAGLEPRLIAETPRAGATDTVAAELLTLDPRPLELGVMS
jgi:predicted phage baseplate assembly protein